MVQSVSEDVPLSTNVAIEYQKSIFAHGSVSQDDFYHVPPGLANATPGKLLKFEADTDVSRYNLPPATTLSRFLYQSQTLQGSPVPASAYVLWPWQVRKLSNGKYPVVAWAHGTSGLYPDGAPSHIKTLSQHWLAPFPLALQGYVVIAPDYVGLGVSKTSDDKIIKHQFLAHQAAANDVLFAVQAAQEACAQLSSEFVVIGHSQGGGAAWGVAQRQAVAPIDGYLGAIAVSPVTNILELPISDNPLIPLLGVYAVPVMQELYPDFDPRALFTDEGWQRYQLDQQIGGCSFVSVTLLTGYQVLRDDWRTNPYMQKYINLTANGGREIREPLLVIQGDEDPNMNVETTRNATNNTVKNFPQSQLQFVTLSGITHVPAMYASQRLWLDWIQDRFDGVPVSAGYDQRSIGPEAIARPAKSYQSDANWIIKTAEDPIQLV